jgi:4-hydroxybenzoate polyprenyltransferase
MKLVKSFFKYQQERFPVLFLGLVSLSGVVGTSAVLGNHNWITVIFGTLVTITFLFHVRVIDEIRDFEHDTEFHPDRPIQKKLISIKELKILRAISLVIFFGISIIFSLETFVFAGYLFLYSSLAGRDFFCSKKIKKYFFLYNLLNMIQLIGLQLVVYTMFKWNHSFSPIILAHITIVFLLSALLEIVRKIKLKENETLGKDTYSSRLGYGGSIILFAINFILIILPLLYILFLVGKIPSIIIPLFVCFLGLYGSLMHFVKKTKLTENIINLLSFVYYLTINIVLYITIK